MQGPSEVLRVAYKEWVAGPPVSLTLSPNTATNSVNTQQCLTAAARDAFGNGVSGVMVRFAVTGAVSTAGAASTNGSGAAQFCYTGPQQPGTDAITAYADTDNDATQDQGEPSGTAAATWTASTYSSAPCLGDMGHTVLQPVNSDGTSIFKAKSTVPVKFRVCDANGNSVGSAGVVSSFALVGYQSGTLFTTATEDVVSTTPDNAFRWDSSSRQWIFNLSTKNLTAGRTYFYRIGLNDGSEILFQFGIR
jgi:hypothetical protein